MAAQPRAQLNEESCPVSGEFFAQLYQSSPTDAVETARDLPEAQRARLAAFCYKRRHLHALGLKIASTCGEHALELAAGAAGETLYKQSRDPDKTLAVEVRPEARYGPKPISLACGGLRDH